MAIKLNKIFAPHTVPDIEQSPTINKISETINKIQDKSLPILNNALSSILLAGQLLANVIIDGYVSSLDGYQSLVSHGLGRNYIGWFNISPQTTNLIYESTSPDRSKYILLNCTKSTTFSIYVF
jgi:hypothetical protein